MYPACIALISFPRCSLRISPSLKERTATALSQADPARANAVTVGPILYLLHYINCESTLGVIGLRCCTFRRGSSLDLFLSVVDLSRLSTSRKVFIPRGFSDSVLTVGFLHLMRDLSPGVADAKVPVVISLSLDQSKGAMKIFF